MKQWPDSPEDIGRKASYSPNVVHAHNKDVSLLAKPRRGYTVIPVIVPSIRLANLFAINPGDIIVVDLAKLEQIFFRVKSFRKIKGCPKPYRSVVIFQFRLFFPGVACNLNRLPSFVGCFGTEPGLADAHTVVIVLCVPFVASLFKGRFQLFKATSVTNYRFHHRLELRKVHKGFIAHPGFYRRGAEVGADETDGNIQAILKIFSKVIPHCRKRLQRLLRQRLPSTTDNRFSRHVIHDDARTKEPYPVLPYESSIR